MRRRLTQQRMISYTTPRADLLAVVPPVRGRLVVDVGCSTGAFAAGLRSRGADCIGIERDPHLAERAALTLERVVVGDALEALHQLKGERVEASVVVFGDVLEHLVDPWAAVDAAIELMPQGGWLVASVPNVAHYDTLVHLLLGRWPLRDRGIHDDTHLRFFARRDALELMGRGRATPELVTRNYRVIEAPHPINRLSPLVGWIWPNGFTFQYLIRSRVAPLLGSASAG